MNLELFLLIRHRFALIGTTVLRVERGPVVVIMPMIISWPNANFGLFWCHFDSTNLLQIT